MCTSEELECLHEPRVRDGQRLSRGIALARPRLVRHDEIEGRHHHDVLSDGAMSGIRARERSR